MATVDFASRRSEVRQDRLDSRDRGYVCPVEDPPESIPLDEFKQYGVPVLDQAREPSCTGMALAGVANYMLRRHWDPDAAQVSPRMMYEMARRHDHLSDAEEGSNLRGAVKGWFKHGVCSDELWPYTACIKHGRLNFERVVDAAHRLMHCYVRVDRSDLRAIKCAIAEFGVLYAASRLHEGWDSLDEAQRIVPNPPDPKRGGHAFVMVGYNDDGFLIQNSWDTNWGVDGCAVLRYEDWLENGLDVWAVEVDLESLKLGERHASGNVDDSVQAMFLEMWPHVLVIGDDGRLTRHGTFAAAPEDLVALVEHYEEATRDWETRRVVLYAGAGLQRISASARELLENRAQLLEREIYPIFMLWNTDWMTPVGSILETLATESTVGDDDAVALRMERSPSWSMIRDAVAELRLRGELAVEVDDGAARMLVEHLLESFVRSPFEIHLAAHGTGDALMSSVAGLIAEEGESCGATINSCTLWAPASTVARFGATYTPLLERGVIEHVGIVVLDDEHEHADSVGPYPRSPLHLLESCLPHLPDNAVIGLERTMRDSDDMADLRKEGKIDLVVAPTDDDVHPLRRSNVTTHAGFVNDPATIAAAVGRILGHSDLVQFEIESRDPLVRAKVVQRIREITSQQRRRQQAIEECEECRALQQRTAGG